MLDDLLLLLLAWSVSAPAGRALARICISCTRVSLCKTTLSECADQAAYVRFVRRWHRHPRLCILAHQLHAPADMERLSRRLCVLDSAGIRDRVKVR
jgi:hypothetical protein